MNLGPEKCNPCSKSFLSKESMQIHFCKIHKNGTHHCHVCKAVYVSQNDLENHYETIHENPELHQCLICKISFINDYSLQKHIQTTKHKQSVHEEKNLENTKTDSQTILDQIDVEMDEECDESKMVELNIDDFVKISTQDVNEIETKTHPLGIQNNSKISSQTQENSETSLKVKQVQKIETVQCKFCLKQFSSNTNLENHIKVRHLKDFDHIPTNEKFYECEKYSEKFEGYNSYTSHLKESYGKIPKKYVCNICSENIWCQNKGMKLEMHIKGKKI